MQSLTTRTKKSIAPLLKNEYAKRLYAKLGIRKPFVRQEKTAHYRMPVLEEHGGYLELKPYSGPEIPASEWTQLVYVTYPTDPDTYFAPLTSATGENILRGFWAFGKPDLDGMWTSNAAKCPKIVRYICPDIPTLLSIPNIYSTADITWVRTRGTGSSPASRAPSIWMRGFALSFRKQRPLSDLPARDRFPRLSPFFLRSR